VIQADQTRTGKALVKIVAIPIFFLPAMAFRQRHSDSATARVDCGIFSRPENQPLPNRPFPNAADHNPLQKLMQTPSDPSGVSDAPLRRVWLFRHGLRADWETDFTPPMALAQDNDIAPAGRQQFEYCAEYLARQPIDHLVSSPYRRCAHSAEIIARRCGLPIKLEWGIHESHGNAAPAVTTREETARRYPHVDLATPSILPGPAAFEEEADWRRRSATAIQSLLRAYPGNLCIVSHGHPILGMQQALRPGFQHLGMRCGSFSRFDLHPDGWRPGIAYSIDHLGPVDASQMRHVDWDEAEEARRLESWVPPWDGPK
jgi:broad specificity phosphatase PhoE